MTSKVVISACERWDCTAIHTLAQLLYVSNCDTKKRENLRLTYKFPHPWGKFYWPDWIIIGMLSWIQKLDITFDINARSTDSICKSPYKESPLNLGTLKCEVSISDIFFTDTVPGTLFVTVSTVGVFTRYQFVNSFILIPGERYRDFFCNNTVFVYIRQQ